MSERFKLIGGVLNIILNDKNEVLMTLRNHKFDSKKYSLPENFSEYAKRAIDNYINKEYFSEIVY